jgi:hypothetical protein
VDDEPWAAQAPDQQAAPGQKPGSRLDDYLVQAARWSQDRIRRGAEEQLPALDQSAHAGSAKWFKLARSISVYGPVQSAIPGADQLLSVVQALYDVEDEQARVLHSIDSNVRLLKDGAFRTGRLMLSEATRVGAEDPEYGRLLGTAKDKFYEAQPLASSVQERAMVEMHLGLVSLPLGRNADARYWLEQSYQSARAVIDALTEQTTKIKVLKSKWTTTALSIYYPAGLLVVPMKLKRVWSAERARTALVEYLPFANSVAECLNTLNDQPVVPTLELVNSPSGELTLHETGPAR